MDGIIEDFSLKLGPSLEAYKEINGAADSLVQMFKKKSKFPISHWQLVGGLESKTFPNNSVEIEMVIYVGFHDQLERESVLEDWQDVLLLNFEQGEKDMILSHQFLTFQFKNCQFRTL